MKALLMRSVTVLLAGLFLGLGSLSLSLLAPAVAQAQNEKPRHPLQRALTELREAKKVLEKAGHDFGGHKEDAIKATDHAIKHLDKMLVWVKEHRKEELTAERKDERYEAKKGEKYPRLHAAVHELRLAHKYLKDSDHDFGGQKKEALESIDHAIKEIERALEYKK